MKYVPFEICKKKDRFFEKLVYCPLNNLIHSVDLLCKLIDIQYLLDSN